MRNGYWLALGLALWVVVAVVGCGGSKNVAIQGEVTLDGQPVGPGSIVFYPEGGSGAPASAAIENGRYEIPPERGPTAGTYRIEISWPKKTGKTIPSNDPGFTTEETVEAIPPKYNSQTTLKAEISSSQSKHDFPLTTQ